MNAIDSINNTAPYVLIEGPRWGDAEFYGKWLLAVAKAQALWEEASNDLSFEKQIELVTVIYRLDFGMGATVMLSKLDKNLASITIGLNNAEWIEFDLFTMMVGMGFFVLTGDRYQMAIPSKLEVDTVKRAVLTYARTEDDEGILRPENLVATMSYTQAKEWQARLRHMDQNHRCADRLLLLDGTSDRPPTWESPHHRDLRN